MTEQRLGRNKTICTPLNEGMEYMKRCISVTDIQTNHENILDKTINGDMFNICSLLPPKSFDLIIADPPYNLSKTYNGTKFVKKTEEDYERYTLRWLNLVKPLLKENGSIYVCCDWKSSLIIGRVIGKLFHVRNRITWQREKGRGAKSNWKNGMEDIWFATNNDEYNFNLDSVRMRRKVLAPYKKDGKPKGWKECANGNYRDTCPSNFWDDITIPFWSMDENTAHPTQKPEKLIAKIILASTNEGDVVFDPFLGSGTTSVVAKKLNRHYVGIEIEKKYCIWAEQRIEKAKTDDTIQGYTNGVFWERNTLSLQQMGKNSLIKNRAHNSKETSKSNIYQQDLFDL